MSEQSESSARVCRRNVVGRIAVALVATALGAGSPAAGHAAEVEVRHQEGVTRGFLVVRTSAGEIVAEGDLLQRARPEGVESRLVFRFRDGSVFDETVLFSQRRVFTMLRYRLEQRGPTFPEALQVSLERDRDQARGRYAATARRHGEEEERAGGEIDLPLDTYIGMATLLLRNLGTAATTVHTMAFTPKATLLQLELAPEREESIAAGERHVPATRYVLKPKLGMLRGAVAALIGKTPADYRCWIATAGLPAFVAIDGPLFPGGPIWRIETVSPRSLARAVAR
jgi:hypothetical protein